MTKPITFEKNKFFLIRKLIGFSVLIFGILCLCLMLLGFVPLKNQEFSVVEAVKLLFESLRYLTPSFLHYFVVGATLSIVYFVFVIKTVKNIFQFIKSLRCWVNDTVDSVELREETRALVDTSSMILWRLIALYSFSYMFSAFSVSWGNVFVIMLLIVINIGMQGMQNILYTKDLETGILSSVGMGMILASIVIFTVTSFRIQMADILLFLKMTITNEIGGDRGVMFSQNVFLPAMYVITLMFLIVLYPIELKKLTDSKKYTDLPSMKKHGEKKATFILIQNIILLGFGCVLLGSVRVLFEHLLLIIIPVILYLCLKNAFDYAEDQLPVSEETVEVTAEETSVEE